MTPSFSSSSSPPNDYPSPAQEGNKDEAQKCFIIAKQHFEAGNYDSAHKFAEKSIRLYASVPAQQLLLRIVEARTNTSREKKAEGAKSSSGNSNTHSTEHTKPATSGPASQKAAHTPAPHAKDYTPEQLESVKKFKKKDKNDYYAVLDLAKDASDADIKRSYKKMALQFHPDKNGAPGADEAFKAVSRAFTVLGDSDKRSMYDQLGRDPDSMTGGGGASAFGGHPFFGGGGGMPRRRNPHAFGHDEEISPEDLFNMFFGAMAGQAFGGNPFFAQGGQGPFHRPRHNFSRPSAAPHQQRAPQSTSTLAFIIQLLPLIVLFVVSLFSSGFIFGGGGQSNSDASSYAPGADPNLGNLNAYVSFERAGDFTAVRETRRRRVPYFSTVKFDRYFAGVESSLPLARELEGYEGAIETAYIKRLQAACAKENADRVERANRATGSSTERRKINEEVLPACEKLHRFAGTGN